MTCVLVNASLMLSNASCSCCVHSHETSFLVSLRFRSVRVLSLALPLSHPPSLSLSLSLSPSLSPPLSLPPLSSVKAYFTVIGGVEYITFNALTIFFNFYIYFFSSVKTHCCPYWNIVCPCCVSCSMLVRSGPFLVVRSGPFLVVRSGPFLVVRSGPF